MLFKEVKLTDKHFIERKGERLINIKPYEWNFISSWPKDISKDNIYKAILIEIKKRILENLREVMNLDTSINRAAIVSLADIFLFKNDKNIPLLLESVEGGSIGNYFYIPVIDDAAETLMLVDKKLPQQWIRKHFGSIIKNHKDKDISENDIKFYNLFQPIIIDYKKIVNNLQQQENVGEKERIFNRNQLSYKVLPDYRLNRAGVKTTLDIEVPGEGVKSFPITKSSGSPMKADYVEVDTGSSGNAYHYYLKLNNKLKNGFKPLQVDKDGDKLRIHDVYSSLAFNDKGDYIEKYKTSKMESINKNIKLLEKLTSKKVILIEEAGANVL